MNGSLTVMCLVMGTLLGIIILILVVRYKRTQEAFKRVIASKRDYPSSEEYDSVLTNSTNAKRLHYETRVIIAMIKKNGWSSTGFSSLILLVKNPTAAYRTLEMVESFLLALYKDPTSIGDSNFINRYNLTAEILGERLHAVADVLVLNQRWKKAQLSHLSRNRRKEVLSLPDDWATQILTPFDQEILMPLRGNENV